jgi:hypothetical protein
MMESQLFSKMKNIVFIFLAFFSCSESVETSKYFTANEADSLLSNIVTYISLKAPNATNETKFRPEFKKFYQTKSRDFKIEKIKQLKDSSYVFFMVRPVGNTNEFKRGVIGKFRLSKPSMMPLEFEEIVNTPHLKEFEVLERGGFLYNEYLKTQNLEKYLKMKHYIEWPDSTLVYDKKINEWVSPKYLSK